MNPQLMWHLYRSYFTTEFKSKVFFYLSIFTIIMIIVIKFLLDPVSQAISPADEKSLAFGNFGVFYLLSGMWMDIIIVVFSLRSVKGDFDYKVTPQMLSLPCHRWEYYIAKILGAWSFSGFFFLVMCLVGATWISADQGINVYSFKMLSAFSLTMLRSLTLVIMCSFASLFFSKLVTFASFVFFLPLQSYTNSYFRSNVLKDVAKDLGFFETCGIILHNIFPRLGTIDVFARDQLTRGFIKNPPIDMNFAVEVPHYLGLTLLILLLSLLVFQKRDII
ncbi:MAG: hypothetical protein HN509_10830 [Halobacteriovoraceae bacterium]|mgnify:FL=1|nr:hypothetical protein [Halobacteriovoraceae bacterium]MBT5092908.1 hypothetical protein [Halobacteriovoraceae bacterium]